MICRTLVAYKDIIVYHLLDPHSNDTFTRPWIPEPSQSVGLTLINGLFENDRKVSEVSYSFDNGNNINIQEDLH